MTVCNTVSRRLAAIAVLPLLLITAAPSVSAQDIGDVAAGRHLAETWCANCHVVKFAQSEGASTGAPSFPSVAAQKAITPMALAVWLQTPHHRMPDFHLTRNEIDDVSAYILSLRKPPE